PAGDATMARSEGILEGFEPAGLGVRPGTCVKRFTLLERTMCQDNCATHHDARVLRDAQTHHCDGNRCHRCSVRRLVYSHSGMSTTRRAQTHPRPTRHITT